MSVLGVGLEEGRIAGNVAVFLELAYRSQAAAEARTYGQNENQERRNFAQRKTFDLEQRTSTFKVDSSRRAVCGWLSVAEAGPQSPPDGDGVSEARQKFLHVEEARDLLQDEPHVRVQVVHRAHLVVDADGRRQRVGERLDQVRTVVVV